MTEFEVGGQQYRCGKLDAFKQFHVTRRLAPVVSGLAASQDGSDGTFSRFLQPLAGAIAGMPDADCDFILQTCLGVVQRRQGDAWVGVYAQGSRALMFDDIDMGVMIQLTVKAIEENLGSFFTAGVELNMPATPTH